MEVGIKCAPPSSVLLWGTQPHSLGIPANLKKSFPFIRYFFKEFKGEVEDFYQLFHYTKYKSKMMIVMLLFAV